MPGQHPPHPPHWPPHVPPICTRPMPTPSTERCSNSFIVNLLLYGWFITKGFSLSVPSWWGVHVDCLSIQSQHQPSPQRLTVPMVTVCHTGGGPRAVLMLIVNLFNPVLKMHKSMKQTPSNSRDVKGGYTSNTHSNRNRFLKKSKNSTHCQSQTAL